MIPSLSVYVGYSQRFSGTVDDDTLQTPEKRSCSLVLLLNGSSKCIYLSPISSSIFVTCSASPNRTVLKTALCLLFTSFAWDYFLSFSVSICVFQCAFALASVYGFQYSFYDATLPVFHVIIQKTLFSTIVTCVLMFGKRHADMPVRMKQESPN